VASAAGKLRAVSSEIAKHTFLAGKRKGRLEKKNTSQQEKNGLSRRTVVKRKGQSQGTNPSSGAQILLSEITIERGVDAIGNKRYQRIRGWER